MNRLLLNAVSVCALLALAGCGVGGSSGTPTPTPTPTPSPTPSPTPTPTPTPTPSFTYDRASDFTRDRSFTAIGTTATLVYAPDGAGNTYTYSAALDAESSMIGFDFTAATRRYRARYRSDAIDVLTAPVTLPQSSNRATSWDEYQEPVDPASSFGRYFARTPFREGLAYAGFALWREPDGRAPMQAGATLRIHRLLFGARTEPADLPTSGAATYNVNVDVSNHGQSPRVTISLIGSGAQPAIAGETAIDWSTRRLTGRIQVAPPSGTGTSTREPTVYTVDGAVSAAGRLSGTVTGNGYSGSLDGNVYGPRAAEIGFLFTFGGPAPGSTIRQEFTGAVLGAR